MTPEEYAKHDKHRAINYRLCTALDLINLGIVLDEMVASGVIEAMESRIFALQASILLTSMRNANNRSIGKPNQHPIL